MKHIVFILPGYGRKPVGGYAVVYEYANKLSNLGYTVTIVHPRIIRDAPIPKGIYRFLKERTSRIHDFVTRPNVHWHDIEEDVEMLYIAEPVERYIPDADAVIATAWQTAEYVWKYASCKGKKVYLIQHYESWSGPEEKVRATWLYPIKKVVIAKWLYDKGKEIGVPDKEIKHIPNGIDHKKYHLSSDVELRPKRIAMMYSLIEWKGSDDGVRALKIAKRRHPDLSAVLFGTSARPRSLPDWIEYKKNPPQDYLTEEIYNGSSIYLCPSWAEGWHLPPAEAMACGCAIVTTDIGGVRDYAIDGKTALLSPVKSPESLAGKVTRLLDNDRLRLELALNGYEYIQRFSWEHSANVLAAYIEDDMTDIEDQVSLDTDSR